jgi:hypothetical protein
MSESKEHEKTTPIDLIYVGRRKMNNGKSENAWLTEEGDIAFYKKFRPYGVSIGTKITIDRNEQGNIIVSTVRNPRQESPDEDVARWEVKDKSCYAEDQKEKLFKRFSKSGGIEKLTEPLRRIYRRLNTTQQRAFLLLVIDEIED